MNFQDAYNEIIACYKKGGKRGLSHVSGLLDVLGNPQRDIDIIHIAGTNGKGSTIAMLSSILRQRGHRVGMFTSPHLISFTERYMIDGVPISEEDFCSVLQSVIDACAIYFGNSHERLSFFEMLTVMAFVYFKEQDLDFLLLETGIGGRLDATNVITEPVLSVITRIALDHTDMLGDTVERIAAEKAGIIKSNRPCVLFEASESVTDVVRHRCAETGSRLYAFSKSPKLKIGSFEPSGSCFSVDTEYFTYDDIELPLAGEHQIYNASGVLLCVRALNDLGLAISKEHLRDGLKHTIWPGRMEFVSENPPVILDGAHNPDGAYALKTTLMKFYGRERVIMVAGVLEHKDCAKIINILAECTDRLVLTKPKSHKGMPPSELMELLNVENVRRCEPVLVEDCSEALHTAASRWADGDVIVVAGSLYLVGDVKEFG